MTKLTCPFTRPDLRHSEERSDEESLQAQRNQWGIAASLRSDSAVSGEIPLPTAVGIGMTRWGSGEYRFCEGSLRFCRVLCLITDLTGFGNLSGLSFRK